MADTFQRQWRDALFLVAGCALGAVFVWWLEPGPPQASSGFSQAKTGPNPSAKLEAGTVADPEPDALSLLHAARHSSATAWKTALAMYRAPESDEQLAWAVTVQLDSKGLSQLAAALAEAPPSQSNVDTIGSVYYRWGAVDPAAAFAQARTLPPHDREQAVDMVMHGLIRRQPAQACSLLATVPPGSDPGALGELQNPTWRRRMLESAFDTWTKKDPAAAAGFYDRLPSDQLADHFVWQIAENWASQNPAAALDWASHLTGKARTSALQGGLKSWAETDPAKALDYLARLPDNHHQDDLENGLIQGWVAHSPAEAAKWADSLKGDAAVSALSSVAQHWVQSDANAAAAWAAGLSSEQAQAEAWPVVARQLATDDPEAAERWLGSLPAGVNQDEAIYAYCEMSGPGNDPVKLYGWEQRIRNPQRRDQVTAENLSKWLDEQPEAARRWIDQAKLPVSVTERVHASSE